MMEDKVFKSFVLGQIKNCIYTANNTFILIGEDPFYKYELVEGDKVCVLKFDGAFTEDMTLSINSEDKIIIL